MKRTVQCLLILSLLCVGLLPGTQAVAPPPDGGYPGGNTAEGQNALLSLSTGTYNTAVGFGSLATNGTGAFNTAIGAGALLVNTADNNTATGAGSLLSNTTGNRNTANGAFALFNNTTGDSNTGQGWEALLHNTTGARNTASGHETLVSNTTGFENTATGSVALQANTSGHDNTATGFAALNANTTGSLNATVGTGSLVNSNADLNTALGFAAGVNLTTGINNIDIGNLGVAQEANTIRIGTEIPVTDPFGVMHPAHTAAYIAGISGAVVTGGDNVFINTDGKLGTTNVPSAARFKQEIKPMDKASEVILALNPVTFRYKKEVDPTGVPQFGLVAEEVEKTAPELVKRNRNGEVVTVRYEAVNAMLLNEFLKQHRRVDEQQAQISDLNSRITRQDALVAQRQEEFQARIVQRDNEIRALTAILKKQAAQIQKVSGQIGTRDAGLRLATVNR